MKLSKLLLAASLVFSLSACSSSSQSESEVVDEVDNAELSDETGAEEAEKIEAETDAESGTEEGTVNGVDMDYTSVSYVTVDDIKYVVVDITVTNIGNVVYDLNVDDFSLENGNDVTVSPLDEAPEGVEDVLTSTEMEPEETLTGKLVFEEPEDASSLILTYKSSSAEFTWGIN